MTYNFTESDYNFTRLCDALSRCQSTADVDNVSLHVMRAWTCDYISDRQRMILDRLLDITHRCLARAACPNYVQAVFTDK